MAGRKKQAKNRRPSSGVAVRLIIMLAVVAAIVFGVAIFFKVTTIEVQGNTLYSAEDVIAAVVYFADHTVTLYADGKDFPAFHI